LPHLIQGLENEVDWRFFHHFNMRLSTVLTLYREQKNPFQGELRRFDMHVIMSDLLALQKFCFQWLSSTKV
jgi:hypothetical protein